MLMLKKYLIQTSGASVCSRKIEEILLKHPAVEEAAVIGVEDPYRCAFEIEAFVVLHESYDGRVAAKDLIDFSKQYVADYKIPMVIEFRESLPKTPLGKIDKNALKKEGKIL